MKFILRLLLSAVAVVVLSKVLPNVSVDTYTTALIVAIALSLLKFFGKTYLSNSYTARYYTHFWALSTGN